MVSVGSLSAGGAGKTPVVLMLAELLGRHGMEVDVLSRGYGRGSRSVEEVDLAGPTMRFGDEPVEMARAGLKVFVGADRWAAGRLAEEGNRQGRRSNDTSGHATSKTVHLLDDGFQHRRLHRDLNVVLLTVEDVRDCLLPGGNLREPLSSLERADVVVVRAEESAALAGLIAARTNAEVWVVRRELVLPAQQLQNPLVFCGIARPEGFMTMLQAAGVHVAASVLKPDHHAYTSDDIALLVESARRVGAGGFYTTAKDAVKITPAWKLQLEQVGSVVVVGLKVSLVDEASALRRLRLACGI